MELVNYLGIGTLTDRITWVVISKCLETNKVRMTYGIKMFEKDLTMEQQSSKLVEEIIYLIKEHHITFVVNKWVDLAHIKTFEALDLVRHKERIIIACGMTNTIFIDPDSYGWEKYMAQKMRTNSRVKIVNKIYGIDIKSEHKGLGLTAYRDIADTIILTEGIAFGTIVGRNKQLMDYDFNIGKHNGS